MDEPNTVVADPIPQAPASPPPAQNAELRYQRRVTLLGNKRAKLVLGLVVIVLVVGGLFAWHYFSSYESTDDAQVDGHVNSVSARVSGHVTKLNVDDNQFVQQGTVLVEIDPADYQVAVEQAQAE